MNRFRTFAAILALSAAWPSPASAGHACALWELYTTDVNGTPYTTYYCDYYQGDACGDSPDSATEYTLEYMEAPVWPCDRDVCQSVDGFKMKGGSPTPAGDDGKAPGADARQETDAATKTAPAPSGQNGPAGKQPAAAAAAKFRREASGLPSKVKKLNYKHKFPGENAWFAVQIGMPRYVKIQPMEGDAFYAVEFQYRIPVPHEPGPSKQSRIKPRDIFVAFEGVADLGPVSETYENGPEQTVSQRSSKVFAIDTGATYSAGGQKLKKTVLVLRSKS